MPPSNLLPCLPPPQLYNEEILDLFDSARDPDSRHRKSNIKIHEDASGSIYTTGVTSRLISSQDEVGDARGLAAAVGWPLRVAGERAWAEWRGRVLCGAEPP